MYYPNKEEFIKLSKQGNVIPVYREVLADFDTPLSAFMKIGDEKFSYLLESVEGGEHIARYSFLGTDPSLIIQSKDKIIKFIEKSGTREYKTNDPIEEIKKYMQNFKFVEVSKLPRFCGGLVGFMGYDIIRFIEDIPDKNSDDYKIPDMQFVLTDTIIIFDHVDHKIKVVSNCLIDKDSASEAYDKACKKIDKLVDKLDKNLQRKPREGRISKASKEIKSNFTKEEFYKKVEKAKEYISQGEIIQVVLSQRFLRETDVDGFSIYRALRSINPSPYMYYLKFGDYKIIGSSPEILVRCEDGNVEVRPIAGTRKRGKNPEEDKKMEKELINDPKERAEHIMLVDLGRNDIGRVCEYSTVEPKEIMHIEKYSHVMHIVTNVTGKLRKDKDIFDVIKATFPAGTVTGAPKVRAMEIIDELEDKRRGPYSGSVGYISFSGNIDLCITIRTIVMEGNKAYMQAGAGIVLDSKPESEYVETQNKAKAMIKAIELAEEGLE